jgi:hypothetical protein
MPISQLVIGNYSPSHLRVIRVLLIGGAIGLFIASYWSMPPTASLVALLLSASIVAYFTLAGWLFVDAIRHHRGGHSPEAAKLRSRYLKPGRDVIFLWLPLYRVAAPLFALGTMFFYIDNLFPGRFFAGGAHTPGTFQLVVMDTIQGELLHGRLVLPVSHMKFQNTLSGSALFLVAAVVVISVAISTTVTWGYASAQALVRAMRKQRV